MGVITAYNDMLIIELILKKTTFLKLLSVPINPKTLDIIAITAALIENINHKNVSTSKYVVSETFVRYDELEILEIIL